MNSILESKENAGIEERTVEPLIDDASLQAAKMSEENQSPEEDVKFVSELGWLAAASVTIASIAASVA